MSKSRPTKPYFAATLAGLSALAAWSTAIGVTRIASEKLGGLFVAGVIYAVAGSFYEALTVLRNNSSRHGIKFGSQLGLFVCYVLCFYSAVGGASSRSDVLMIGCIQYLWPVLSALFISAQTAQRNQKWPAFGGVLLSFCGYVYALKDTYRGAHLGGVTSLWEIVLALLAAVSFALLNSTRKLTPTTNPNFASLFLPTGISCLILCGTFDHWPSTGEIQSSVPELLLLLLIPLGYLLWDLGIRLGEYSVLASSAYFVPLFSLLTAEEILEVHASGSMIPGLALVGVGTLISGWSCSSSGSG